MKLQFRADFVNTFNNVNLNSPTSSHRNGGTGEMGLDYQYVIRRTEHSVRSEVLLLSPALIWCGVRCSPGLPLFFMFRFGFFPFGASLAFLLARLSARRRNPLLYVPATSDHARPEWSLRSGRACSEEGSQPGTVKTVRRTGAFAGVRCSMVTHRNGAAVDFLELLNREFPGIPTFSLLRPTPIPIFPPQPRKRSPGRRQLHRGPRVPRRGTRDAGKVGRSGERVQSHRRPESPAARYPLSSWAAAALEARRRPAAGDDAKKEFQAEFEIDPSNAGAEYVLGELARQDSQWDEAIQHFSRATELDASLGMHFSGSAALVVSQAIL